jgi:vacuolar protein sorting-associated protein 13D
LGQLDDYSPSCEFPSRAPEFEIMVSSRASMEINITSTLLNLYNTVSSNWTEDYQLQKNDKRRAPFVPFALKNETGSRLWFCTIISNNEEVFRQQQKGIGGCYTSDTTSWIEVGHGSVQNFSFEGRGKLRHRNTHQLKTHQLAIRVDGWQEVTPVSVDRVGTYFRVAKPETSLRRYGGYMELPPTRLVLEVALHGSAQKIVTVRSALMIKNSLPDPVELKLENTIVYPSFERAQTGGSMIFQVRPGQTYPIPLHSVWAHMWIRPVIPDDYPLKYQYCSKALLIGSSQEGLRECAPRSPEFVQPYRFCVAVKRNEFPADGDDIIPQNSQPNIVQLMCMSNRANLITLLSPFKLVNLLPHEISYEIKNKNIFGRIAPGKYENMSNVSSTTL